MERRVLPRAAGMRGTVRRTQFLGILFGWPQSLRKRTLGLGRHLPEVIFEILQQDIGLIRREVGKRRANRGRVGRNIVCLIVTGHDRCSFRLANG